MRRLCTVLILMAASALSAQTAPEEQPQLIKSAEVQPGDSVLVQAAKRALARRQSAKDRGIVVKVSGSSTGAGHISQPAGPMKELKLPPPNPEAKPLAIDPNVIRARNEEIERKIKALQDEQNRLGAEADEPYAGDGGDEDDTERRMTTIQQKIDELHRLQNEVPKPPPG